MSEQIDFERLLTSLAEHEVEFLVVGGIAAVLQGAPIATFDLDIVHRLTPDNVERLLSTLRGVGATYRGQGDRVIEPTADLLSTRGHHLFRTAAGPLDVLGSIGNDRDFDALRPHARLMPVGERLQIAVLELPMLIVTKEEADRERDRAVLPILRRTLEERDRR